jgi:hypothetical protein
VRKKIFLSLVGFKPNRPFQSPLYKCDLYVTDKTGTSSDDWIYYQLITHSLVITLKYRQYRAISSLHQLQFTVAHALGFPVSISRFPATDLVITLKCRQYSAISRLNQLQFTVEHALGFPVSTSRFPATDLNTHII